VRTQNWTAIALDFVIVVGVFLGLQVQEWAEERGRRQLEASYTRRLHNEVVDLQRTREPLLDIRDRWNAGLLSVTPVLFGAFDQPIRTGLSGRKTTSQYTLRDFQFRRIPSSMEPPIR